MVLDQVIRIILLTTIAFLWALLTTPFWYKLIIKYQVKKRIRTADEAPIFSKLHSAKAGTPTAGGIIFWSTVMLMAFVFAVLSQLLGGNWKYLNFVNRAETYLPLAALLGAAVFGLLDDWFGVLGMGGAKSGGFKVRHKLLIYTVLAAIGAWWFYVKLGWDVLAIPFFGTISIGPWYIPVFIFIIVATAFSANETDGLDGLLGGVSLFAFVALTVVAFSLKRYDLAVFGGTMIGSLLAFLWFNIYPAKFMMGDTGSMSLGITMGVIALLTNTALLLPFFGFILAAESLSVIVQLISKKVFHRKLFHSTPIHHHFEALGWPESQVTMRFWIISAVASTLGVVIFFLTKL